MVLPASFIVNLNINQYYIFMKKFLLTTAILAWAGIGSFAQDTSEWTVGEDVSQYLAWGDYDGTTNDGGFWKGTDATFSFNEWEIFQGSDVDRYQLVYLPAGVYEFRCQGFYRDGDNGTAAKNYFAKTSSTNAVLYVETGEYTEATEEAEESFVVSKTFSSPMSSQWSPENTTHYFETDTWTNDAAYTYNDVEYWAPNCMEGTSLYFQAGLYDENIVKFVVMQDGFVKVGLRKPGTNIPSDWLIFTNFRIIFQGDAGEAAALMIAEEDFENAKVSLVTLENEIMGAGYEGLAGLLEDAIMDLESGIDLTSVEEFEAATAQVQTLADEFKAAFDAAKSLTAIATNCESIAATTDFSGLAAFNSAIAAAQTVLAADVYSIGDKGAYAKALADLQKARGAYLMSQTPNEDGSYDFSRVIANPFFCNDEYTPTWNGSQFVYSDEIEAEWFGENKAWELNAETGDNGARTPLADKVIISNEKEAENVWVVDNKVTSGYLGGYGNVIWTQGYTAVQQWGPEASTGYCEFRQVLNGLPDGYYSMSAMIINDGREITPGGQLVFISNGEQEETTNFDYRYGGWWGNSRDGWQVCSTNMIKAVNGKITIGMRNNNFYAGTGFQLTYYGENPNYNALLASSIEETKNKAATSLTFMGDIAAVDAILANIPETIDSYEAYSTALQSLSEAENYISTATAAINAWTAIDDFSNLMANYEEESDEAIILNTAFIHTLGLGEAPTDTYEAAIASGKDYNAYVDYLSYVEKMKAYATSSPELSTIIASQTEELKAEYANATKLAEMMSALAAPYNAALLASLGADKATESNPVDVTALITNPTFAEGNRGWTGDITVDNELQNGERYNTNFDFYQTLHALPAGCYQIKAKSFYRDGGVGDIENGGAYANWWYGAGGDMEYWENKNVEFYAKSGDTERMNYVVSIANAQFKEPSFTEYISSYEEAEEPDEEGNIIQIPVYTYIDMEAPAYPFDNKVDDLSEVYWYPNSMRGAHFAFEKDTEGWYDNTVSIMVEEGQSLTFGLRKAVTIGGDWCMFDDFQLFYLGTETPSSIVATETNAQQPATYYNISGVRLNAPQKGINIVKVGDKVKKVLVK